MPWVVSPVGRWYSYSEICLKSSLVSSPVSSLISLFKAVITSSPFLMMPPGKVQSLGWIVADFGRWRMRNFVLLGFLMMAVTTVFMG